MASRSNMTVATGGDQQRYTRVAVLLHWTIAAFILFNLTLGPFMEGFPPRWRFPAVMAHVSSGVTVLLLTLARIAWRLAHRAPPLVGPAPWEATTAKFVHVVLYFMMLFIPLSGWALISANPPPARHSEAPRARALLVWGVVEWPMIAPLQQIGATVEGAPRQKKIHDNLVVAHQASAFLLMGLLALHILAVVKHQWLDGQAELQRMWFSSERRGGEGAGRLGSPGSSGW